MINLKKLKRKVPFYQLAKKMKVTSSTLYSWKDKIPYWRVPAVIKACKELGVDISDCIEEE